MINDQGKLRKRVVVIGLGRQGWAITKQLVQLAGDPPEYELYVYDVDQKQLKKLQKDSLSYTHTDYIPLYEALRAGWLHTLKSTDQKLLRDEIVSIQPDLLINAAVFRHHEFYTDVAFAAGCDYVDLGQSTWQAMKQRALDSRIHQERKNICIVPECGYAPGLVNIFGAWLHNYGGDSVQLRAGGLPMDTAKGGDLHYGASWSIDGLLQEYTDVTIARKGGRIINLFGLTSIEDWEIPLQQFNGIAPFRVTKEALVERLRRHMEPRFFAQDGDNAWLIQNLEARPTSDGISLMPFDTQFSGVSHIGYKTLRFFPHFDTIQRIIADGSVKELTLPSGIPDVDLIRAFTENAGAVLCRVDCVVLSDFEFEQTDDYADVSDPRPIFTAMQHLTGWPTVLVAKALLSYRNVEAPRPRLFQPDHTLWSGRSLDDVLHNGGVVMPYELVDGAAMFCMLDSDALIPHREFTVFGRAKESVEAFSQLIARSHTS